MSLVLRSNRASSSGASSLVVCVIALAFAATASLAAAQTSSARKLFAEAFDLLRAGHAKEATERFETGLTQDPSNALARYYLGEAYEQSGQLSKAIETWNDLVRRSPKSEAAEKAKLALSSAGSSTAPEPDSRGEGWIVDNITGFGSTYPVRKGMRLIVRKYDDYAQAFVRSQWAMEDCTYRLSEGDEVEYCWVRRFGEDILVEPVKILQWDSGGHVTMYTEMHGFRLALRRNGGILQGRLKNGYLDRTQSDIRLVREEDAEPGHPGETLTEARRRALQPFTGVWERGPETSDNLWGGGRCKSVTTLSSDRLEVTLDDEARLHLRRRASLHESLDKPATYYSNELLQKVRCTAGEAGDVTVNSGTHASSYAAIDWVESGAYEAKADADGEYDIEFQLRVTECRGSCDLYPDSAAVDANKDYSISLDASGNLVVKDSAWGPYRRRK